LNPYAIEKHKPNEKKLIHYKSQEYYQSECGKNTSAKKEKESVTNLKKTSMIIMKKESFITNCKNVINSYMAKSQT
jgi:hypothetical protein